MCEKCNNQPSRDRKGAVFAHEAGPLPHRRGSERGYSNALIGKEMNLDGYGRTTNC